MLETSRARKQAKLISLDEGVDVPSATEAFDRVRGFGFIGRSPKVVADQEQPARSNEAATLCEEARGILYMREGFDRIRQVRRAGAGRQIAVVTLDTADAISESRLADALVGEARLNRAQRDPGAADWQTRGQITQARTDAATEIDYVRCLERGRQTL